MSTGVLKSGSRTRDTVGVNILLGMTAGTKGEDPDMVSRELLIDPGELLDASRSLGGD